MIATSNIKGDLKPKGNGREQVVLLLSLLNIYQGVSLKLS